MLLYACGRGIHRRLEGSTLTNGSIIKIPQSIAGVSVDSFKGHGHEC